MNINLNKKAYSLIELLIVVFIIGLVTTIAVTALTNKSKILKKEVLKLYNNLQYARIYAIKNRTEVIVTFYPDNNYYIIKLSDNNSVRYNLDSAVEYGDGGHSNISNHKVAFGNTNPPKEIFTPLGFAKYMGSVYLKLKNSNDNVYQISVNLSGKITVKKWDGSNFVE